MKLDLLLHSSSLSGDIHPINPMGRRDEAATLLLSCGWPRETPQLHTACRNDQQVPRMSSCYNFNIIYSGCSLKLTEQSSC